MYAPDPGIFGFLPYFGINGGNPDSLTSEPPVVGRMSGFAWRRWVSVLDSLSGSLWRDSDSDAQKGREMFIVLAERTCTEMTGVDSLELWVYPFEIRAFRETPVRGPLEQLAQYHCGDKTTQWKDR